MSTWPSITIFPQYPGNTPYDFNWQLTMAVLATVTTEWNCDVRRTYLTGLSFGGLIAYSLLYLTPNTWAAFIGCACWVHPTVVSLYVPVNPLTGSVAGALVASKVSKLPIWQFQGSLDVNIPPDAAHATRDAFFASGNPNYHFTEYSGSDHATTWITAYADPNTWTWLYSQSVSSSFDSVAELPRRTPQRVYPTINGTSTVVTAATIQSTINSLAALTSSLNHEVVVQDGQIITSQVMLPYRQGTGYIVIRSQTMPCAPGVRAHPTMFTSQAFFKMTTNQPAIYTQVTASVLRYVLSGLHVGNHVDNRDGQSVVDFGYDRDHCSRVFIRRPMNWSWIDVMSMVPIHLPQFAH
jgi:predicted esterase